MLIGPAGLIRWAESVSLRSCQENILEKLIGGRNVCRRGVFTDRFRWAFLFAWGGVDLTCVHRSLFVGLILDAFQSRCSLFGQ